MLKEEEGHAQICSPFHAVQATKIVEATRLGRPTGAAGDSASTRRPSQARVRFALLEAKHQALQAGKDLQRRQVYVDVDLTAAQQQGKRGKRDRYLELKQQAF